MAAAAFLGRLAQLSCGFVRMAANAGSRTFSSTSGSFCADLHRDTEARERCTHGIPTRWHEATPIDCSALVRSPWKQLCFLLVVTGMSRQDTGGRFKITVTQCGAPMTKIKIAFAIWAIGVSMGTSFAADVSLPEVDAYRPIQVIRPAKWTGLYFGVNGGFGWASAKTNFEFTDAALPGTLAGRTATSSAGLSGGIAGGQIGFNWQAQRLVFGLEADGQWSGAQADVTASCGDASCVLAETVRLKSFWSGRVRLGYAFDRILAYATVGGAVVSASHDLTATLGGVSAKFLTLSSSTAGLAAGIGIEAMIWEKWSARAEYLYLDIDDHSATGFAPAAFGNSPVDKTSRFSHHIVRAGLSYRFGPDD